MKQEKNGLYYFLLLLGGLKKYFFLFTSKNMNKLIKIALFKIRSASHTSIVGLQIGAQFHYAGLE